MRRRSTSSRAAASRATTRSAASIPDGAFAKPMSKAQVLEAVQPFLTS